MSDFKLHFLRESSYQVWLKCPVVLKKKILESRQRIFTFSLSFPLGKGHDHIFKQKKILLPIDALCQALMNWPKCNGIDLEYHLSMSPLSPLGKGSGLSFVIWTNWISFTKGCLSARFGWNWSIGQFKSILLHVIHLNYNVSDLYVHSPYLLMENINIVKIEIVQFIIYYSYELNPTATLPPPQKKKESYPRYMDLTSGIDWI